MNVQRKVKTEDQKLNLKLLEGVIETSQKSKPKFSFFRFLKSLFISHQEMTLEQWERLESKPVRAKENQYSNNCRHF